MQSVPLMKPWLGDEEVQAAADAIRSGWVAQGPRVAEFEHALANWVGAAAGVAVSSCTTGLHLVLHALGVGPGDEVVVPSLSFIATANAPRYVGADPVFCDVETTTQNATAATIEAVLTARTKAVIVVHQIGMPAALEEIHALCRERGVAVIEDAACAIGSVYRDARIGSHSDYVVFSFHPRKLLTTGEGGMIMTPDVDAAARLRRLRAHGVSMAAYERHASSGLPHESYDEYGFNFRMTDVQAAIGLAQLAKLERMVDRRRAQAARYNEHLDAVPGLLTPVDPEYGLSNFQSYSLLLSEEYELSREAAIQALVDAGISPRRGVMAAHLEPAYAHVDHAPLPVTEHLTHNSVILPLFHDMTDEEQDRVIDVLVTHGRP